MDAPTGVNIMTDKAIDLAIVALFAGLILVTLWAAGAGGALV